MDKTTNTKVESDKGINFKFPVLKQYDPGSVILRESATEESLRSFASNKGRGETNYGHQTAIVLKKVAMAGFVVAAMGVWFFAGANGAEAANRYRVGTGNWNTTASWSTTSGGASGASVPGSADVAIFEATSTASMTLDATVNVLGVQIDSGYTGTITQGAVTISVGTSGWTQNDGTFSGSSSAITITNGNFTLNTGTTTVPANSTLKFYNSGNATTQTITMASTPTATFTNNTYAATYTITGTMTVNNLTLTVVDTISGGYDDIIILNTGTIDVKGSYTVNLSNGTIDNLSGTSPITLSGEGTQTISGTFSVRERKLLAEHF
ncbi:MAG: hypothetical protein UV72_C0025G0004 [Candidatus Giovannonibacteria bacterium GW2011_GWB1_43_13]|nr:MAG: hypothetical protein UV72_C0025G0004 [Candidatus Giovannonibacteria bacterium GW2011_GWB1_43_13]